MAGLNRCGFGNASGVWGGFGRYFGRPGFVLLNRSIRGSRSFKELDIYVLSVESRREIVRLTSRAPVCRDFDFVKQIRNAARGGPKEHR